MESVTCPLCGSTHDLADMQVGFSHPDRYLEIPEDERETRCWGNEDMRQVDRGECFIRAHLALPVRGRGLPFGWGVWVQVSQKHLFRYIELFRDEAQGVEPPFAGTIANSIEGYPETRGVAVSAQLTTPDLRPALTVLDRSHPLFGQQHDGVTEGWVLRTLHQYP